MASPAGRLGALLQPVEPPQLVALRDRAAVAVAWLAGAGALLVALFGQGPEVPSRAVLAGAALPLMVLAALGQRAARVLRWLLPTYGALVIIVASPEPFISQYVTAALLLPPIFGALLGGPKTVLLSVAVMQLGMGVRGGWGSPYLLPQTWVLSLLAASLLIVAQLVILQALRGALSVEQRLAAIGAEANDLALLLRRAADGQVATTVVAGSVERVLGLGLEAFSKLADAALLHPEDLEAWRALSAAGGASARTSEFRMKHAQGHWVWVSARATDLTGHPDVGGVVVALHDVTSVRTARQALEAMLVHEAEHDGLTGLPNRRWLTQRITRELAQLAAGGQAAVVLVDLDDFNVVNDALGHAHGDEVLVAVGKRLSTLVGPGDVVARLAGDEFIVLFPGGDSVDRASTFCARLHDSFEQPFIVSGETSHLTASLGLVRLNRAHERPEDVFRDCDLAMREAKTGEHLVAQFEDGMRRKVERRHDLEKALRSAIENRDFFLLYQPKLSIADGSIVGFEALVRWRDPTRGVVPPMEFIPLAEETGLIVAIGDWVLREAARQIWQWRAAYPAAANLRMAVNLSAVEAARDDAVVRVVKAVHEVGAEPSCIELEVTETAAMSNAAQMIERLQGLRAVGVHLAIDDFGTGYSSLSYLRRFPFDVLKIDRAFVRRLSEDGEDRDLVRFLVSLAKALDLVTVAEGVETEEQLTALRELGCDIAQGFLIAKPLPPEEIAALLARGAVNVRAEVVPVPVSGPIARA